MRSYLVVCALFIASFALATSGCGSGRGTTEARGGAGGGQGDGSVDHPDVGTGTGGVAGSVGGNGGSAGGSSGNGGSAGGTGGAAGDTGGTGGSAGSGGSGGSGGTTDGGMNNDGGPDGATPTCTDGVKNSDETDIDCGGHCGKCGPGGMCVVNADCTYACRADKTCAACNVAADCTGTESECEHRTCTAGVCGTMRDPAGTVLTVQTTGDCKKRQCAADGTVAVVNDDTDVPNDQNACTNDICTTGAPSHTNTADGSNCGSGNHCQSGTCIGCTVASDCPGTDTACSTRTCSAAGVCGHSFKDAGYKLVDPTAGDCKGLQCDGQGNAQVFNDNADLPADTNPCTTDECSSGTPSHRPVASGTNCGASLVCDGASNCVQCLSPNSCPGTDTECRMRSCILGQCGVTNAAAGTLTAAQTAGDCKKNVCSGGVPIVVNDDLDLPADSNPCTTDVCTGGVPSNPFVTAGSSCGTSTICDGQGACVSCLTAASCPGTDTECHHRTCTDGACGVVNTAAGTALTTQTAGDCKAVQCDGNGEMRTVNDDTDKPVDGKSCTDDLCNAGVPSNPNLSSGTACGNGLMCDGQGGCVGCVTAANCGDDTTCQTHTCTDGMCGVNNTAAGTALATQTAGDCKKVQCDGLGQTQTVNDDSDLPVDGNACTKDLCTNGQKSNPAETAGTACGMGGGTKCNGSATAPACVQCLQASECPGADTDCHHRTCTSGVCGMANEADGKALTTQVAGDCKKDVCMGGASTSVIDNTDVLVDGNGCTMDLCTNGMPSNPPLPKDSSCNESGGIRCNGSATAPACVQCNVDLDCGADSPCQMHTCNVVAGTCITTNVGNGTAVAMQTPSDCQKNVCNGIGGVIAVFDNTDVFVDGKLCTDDLCNAGVPINPPRSAGTPCNQAGGVQCNATGSCVQCLKASDCGTDTDCRKFACSAAGACSSTPEADGKLVNGGLAGDCKKNVCMSGEITPAVDDNDLPVDGNPCTDDVCVNGTPSNTNVMTGVSCGGILMCNGMGSCVGCVTEANCAPPPNACQVAVCMNGSCGFANVANGTVLGTQTAGDCHKDVCMDGSVVSIVDDNDVLVDNNPCTQDLCSGGLRSNPPVGSGVACSVGTGTVCNDVGQCVECLDASTCPGGPDSAPCHVRTCNAGVCGISEPPDGTAVSGEPSGDCQRTVCNGMGGVKSIPDDTDLPINTPDCRTAMCVAGMPMTPAKQKGTACTQGGHVCDSSGSCVDTFCVLRLDGTSSTSAALSIEERRLDGSLVGTTALPTSDSGIVGGNLAITSSGSAASEGGLSLSGDGRYLVLAGYDTPPGTPSVKGAAGINRVVARVAADGTVNSSTSINIATAFNTDNVRSATSQDGSAFWVGGAGATVGGVNTGGIWYVTLGGGTLTQLLNASPTNARWLHVINGQLYGTASQGNFNTVFTVGSGLPTTGPQTATILPGLPTTGPSPFSFVFFDRDSNTPGLDTLYISDDSGGGSSSNQGIQKWTLATTGTCAAGTVQAPCWNKTTTFTLTPSVKFKGLAGLVVSGNVFLMATTDEGTTARLVTFVDTGSGAPTTTVFTTLSANQIYRGVAVSPHL